MAIPGNTIRLQTKTVLCILMLDLTKPEDTEVAPGGTPAPGTDYL